MKNKKLIKWVCSVVAVILALLILLLGGFIYIKKYRVTDIASSVSPNGKYEILYQNIGEPDWPFGSAHVRFVLKKEQKPVIKYGFNVANDGGVPSPKQWNVDWEDSCVQIIISGEEQKDTLYTLWFNKTVDVEIIEQDSDIPDIKKKTFLKQKTNIKKFSVNVLNNRENELVFNLTLNDFINGFNGYYYRKNKEGYILPTSFDNWQTTPLDTAIHSPYETTLYNYSADRKMWSLPTVSAYVPTNSEYIGEITLNFDWHSYTDGLYDLYDEMCYCTLKMFFPELSDKQITELYTKANKLGYDNIFSSDEWYSKDSVPCALFYKDGIGIYSHFAIGSFQRLCIIPVTENTVNEFKEKGVEIFEIED